MTPPLSDDQVCALVGGSLIAAASSFNLLLNGHITGMSGLLSSLVTPGRGINSGSLWKLAAFSGLVTSGVVAHNYFGNSLSLQGITATLSETTPAITGTASLLGAALIGFGTRLGSGCTSGHGVCGIPRLSRRSFVAVLTFMTTGALVATTVNTHPIPPVSPIEHLWRYLTAFPVQDWSIPLCCALNLVTVSTWIPDSGPKIGELLAAYATGLAFGAGLLISGMTRVSKTLGFLTLDSSWDHCLMLVMASAVTINFVTFRMILSRPKPVIGYGFNVPSPQGKVTRRLIAGAAIFGAGWGLVGACPGPAIVTLLTSARGPALLGSVALGMNLYELMEKSKYKLE